jgi:molecular chaperone DnaK (HSP70)
MNVSIENNLIETFELSNEATSFFILKETEQFLENDKMVKEREKERQELKEYIYNTLNTIKQIDGLNMYKKPILEIIHNAEIVSYIEEITLEEIKDVQKELEGNVNLFMHKIKNII